MKRIILYLSSVFCLIAGSVSFGYSQCTSDPVSSLVRNGNFSSGNTQFISGYSYCNSSNCLYPEGYYAIGRNANFYHNAFVGRDHTTGNGNFMIVNGAGVPNTIVWRQNITIKPNTNYNFSAWVTSLVSGSPARLQFMINGVTIGSIFDAPSGSNNWQNFFVTWNSGSNTTAEITILNQNTTLAGNDFGLDDISFIEICGTPQPNLGSDRPLCGVGTITLGTNIPVNATTSVTWSTGTSGTGLTAPYTLTVSTGGKYWVCVKDGSCVKTDTINIIADFSVNLGPDFTLCATTFFILNPGYYNAFTSYKWYCNNVLIPDSTKETYTVRSPGVYKVEVTDASCGIMRTDEVTVNSVSAIPNDGKFCPPAPAVFSVTPNPTGGFKWYDALTGGTNLGKGNSLSLPGSTTDLMMYAEDTTAFKYNVGPNAKFPSGWGNPPDKDLYIMFDAHTSFTLDAVTVFAKIYNPYEAMTIGVTLRDNTGALITQVARNVTGPPIVPIGNDWPFTVQVGFNITPGTGYRLSNEGTVGEIFWAANNTAGSVDWASYKEENIITLTGLDSGQDFCKTTGKCYGFFYNWEISKGNNCARVPVRAIRECPLPVNWLGVEASRIGAEAVVSWVVSNSKNTSHFTIERLTDGIYFEPVGIVKTKENNSSVNTYKFTDTQPPHKVVYYRIVEYDEDRNYSISSVVSIPEKGVNLSILPTKNKGRFEVVVNGAFHDEVQLIVLNSLGQLIAQQTKSNTDGEVRHEFNIENEPCGVYVIQLISAQEMITQKCVKE